MIVLVCATSGVSNRQQWVKKAGLPEKTIVVADKSDWSCLDHQSVFNCNDPIIESIEGLFEKLDANELAMKEEVSDLLLKKLIEGVVSSPMVEENIKILLK